jgi:hypothetical protein
MLKISKLRTHMVNLKFENELIIWHLWVEPAQALRYATE